MDDFAEDQDSHDEPYNIDQTDTIDDNVLKQK